MRTLAIWGAGGHGRVVLDVARAMRAFQTIVFVDDDPSLAGQECSGCRVLSSEDLAGEFPSGAGAMVIAIGSNHARARCAAIARIRGWELAALVHPSAIVSPSARLGCGTVILPRAVVNAGARIGENCIINTAAVVEHDCRVGDHVHLSPGVVLGGAVTIEPFVHMGLGSIALPGSWIGTAAIVGAGAVVLHTVSEDETVVGIPARSTGGRRVRPARVS